MSKKLEIYETQCNEEKSPLREGEETDVLNNSMKAVENPEKFTMLDKLQVVRGYSTYKNRQEDTNEAFLNLEAWRKKVDYDSLLKEEFPQTKDFLSNMWKETAYGCDKYGHLIFGFKLKEVDVSGVLELDEAVLEKLVAQKLKALQKYKEELSKKHGVQRYKASMMIDATGAGTSMMSGKRRAVITTIMNVGSDYFPETMFRIYVYNAPMIFTTIWALVKRMIHPITAAKTYVVRSKSYVYEELMKVDGVPESEIPDVVGGTNAGTPFYKVVQDMIALESAEKSKPTDEPKTEEAKPTTML